MNDTLDQKDPALAKRLGTALQEAIAFCRAKPAEALALYFKANPDVRKVLDEKAFHAVLGQFATTQTQSREKWASFAEFARKNAMISKAVPVDALFRNP